MLHGKSVPLAEPPVIGGAAVHAIDYTPEVCCAEIQRRPCEPRGEMTPAEIADADALLRRLVG